MQETKILISTYGFSAWGGGVDFIRYIATNIAAAQTDGTPPHKIILPKLSLTEQFRYSINQLIQCAKRRRKLTGEKFFFDHSILVKQFSDLQPKIEIIHSALNFRDYLSTTKKYYDHVLLPCFKPIPVKTGIPWVGYLYDFQHIHIPHYFSKKLVTERNNDFTKMLNQADHIIVNSCAVRNDAYEFYDGLKPNIHVLPFSPCPNLEWLLPDESVKPRYGIDRPFLIISNQFWVHKDHKTALIAFSEILKDSPNLLLVCTGDVIDFRFPKLFDEIKELIKSLKIERNVRILGHIPKRDQIELLKTAIAVIQPTLFEGGPGGGSGYDAIAYGTKLILSDIPVNKEISNEPVSFFRAGDPHDLYLKIKSYISTQPIYEEIDCLLLKGINRKKNCGNVLINIAQKANLTYRNKA